MFHGLCSDKQQIIYFRIGSSKLDVGLAHFFQSLKWIRYLRQRLERLVQHAKALLMQGMENFVLVFKIEIDGSGTIFNSFGNAPQADLVEAFF